MNCIFLYNYYCTSIMYCLSIVPSVLTPRVNCLMVQIYLQWERQCVKYCYVCFVLHGFIFYKFKVSISSKFKQLQIKILRSLMISWKDKHFSLFFFFFIPFFPIFILLGIFISNTSAKLILTASVYLTYHTEYVTCRPITFVSEYAFWVYFVLV